MAVLYPREPYMQKDFDLFVKSSNHVLTDKEYEIMSDALETFIFPEGRLLIEEGTPALEAYMIERGKVRVYIEKDGEQVELAQLGEDQIVGETALFSGSEYGANVEALEETTVVKITPEILDIKIRLCDPMLRALIRMMMERQRNTNKQLAELRA